MKNFEFRVVPSRDLETTYHEEILYRGKVRWKRDRRFHVVTLSEGVWRNKLIFSAYHTWAPDSPWGGGARKEVKIDFQKQDIFLAWLSSFSRTFCITVKDWRKNICLWYFIMSNFSPQFVMYMNENTYSIGGHRGVEGWPFQGLSFDPLEISIFQRKTAEKQWICTAPWWSKGNHF